MRDQIEVIAAAQKQVLAAEKARALGPFGQSKESLEMQFASIFIEDADRSRTRYQ